VDGENTKKGSSRKGGGQPRENDPRTKQDKRGEKTTRGEREGKPMPWSSVCSACSAALSATAVVLRRLWLAGLLACWSGLAGGWLLGGPRGLNLRWCCPPVPVYPSLPPLFVATRSLATRSEGAARDGAGPLSGQVLGSCAVLTQAVLQVWTKHPPLCSIRWEHAQLSTASVGELCATRSPARSC